MEEKFKRGPNPFEQPQIGMEHVPPYLKFQPGEENKFWTLDRMHSPEPFYPLEYETSFIALAEYADSTGIELNKLPTSHGEAYRVLNGWCWVGDIDVSGPEEIEERVPKFMEVAERWYSRWEQAVAEAEAPNIKAADWLHSFDFETDPDLSDPKQLYTLIERFDAILSALYRSAESHLQIMVLLFVKKLELYALCRELVPGTADEEVSKMLQGFGNKLMETDAAFWNLGELAHTLGVADVVRGPLEDVIPGLEKTDNGKKWLEELKKTVKEYGMRHVGGCYNLMPVSWIEDLDYPISFVRGFMAKKERGEKLVPKEELEAEREQAVQAFRAKLKSDEDRKRFDETLDLVQRQYPWYEDHNFLYEGRIGTGVHLKIIELGRRLVNEGYLDEPYDIGYLLLHELRQLLYELVLKRLEFRKYNMMDVRPIIKERKEIREKQIQWEPPVVLGLSPLVPPENPLTVLIFGATPENIERAFAVYEKPEEVLEITGLAASPGVAEGLARVLVDVSQLKEVQPGEIIVCSSTNPMWNPVFGKVKAVVTDVGGTMAHAGIVAREYGLPAVVGTGQATKIIKTGDRIRVDGTAGIITKLK